MAFDRKRTSEAKAASIARRMLRQGKTLVRMSAITEETREPVKAPKRKG